MSDKPVQYNAENLTLKELKETSNKDNFDQIISDLKQAFMRDYSNEEACHYAGISESQFYEWKKISEEFRDELERAKSYLKREAKNNIADQIAKNHSLTTSTWFLERRDKDRYSARTENLNTDVSIDDLLKELEDPE